MFASYVHTIAPIPISVALNSHENTIKAVQYLCARLLLIAQSYDSTLARIAQMTTRNEAVSMMQTLLTKEASVVKYTQSLCEKLAMNVSVVCAAEQEVAVNDPNCPHMPHDDPGVHT
jgi:hypothetical protein